MNELTSRVALFEANRAHLRAVASRILGRGDEVDDALQEAWLRWSTSDVEAIGNTTSWLTTVVSRVCLNTLRGRTRRRAVSLDDHAKPLAAFAATPEEQAVLADSMGRALLVVLDRLSPAERIAFVLHDLFSVPFEEVAAILDKSTDACRQLASRARRRVRLDGDVVSDPTRQQSIIEAFLRAAKSGDFEGLLALLSPDVELVADAAAAAMGAPALLRGPHDVAHRFNGGAKAARVALLDGRAGLVWSRGDELKVAFDFTVEHDRVTRIEMLADYDVIGEIELECPTRRRVDDDVV